MDNPNNKDQTIVDELNLRYIPKIVDNMTWDFTGGNILDFGCGSGRTGAQYILPLAKFTNSQLCSVDNNPEKIEYARKYFPSHRTHYAVGSIPDNFPFPNVAFDRVFALDVLHLALDASPILHGIKNILKPGGQLGIVCATLNTDIFKLIAAVGRFRKWKPFLKRNLNIGSEWTNYGNASPVEHFSEVFVDEMGFELVHFDIGKFEMVRNLPVDVFLNHAVAATPFRRKMSFKLLEDLKEEYRRIFTAMNAVPLNTCLFDYQLEYFDAVLQKPLQ